MATAYTAEHWRRHDPRRVDKPVIRRRVLATRALELLCARTRAQADGRTGPQALQAWKAWGDSLRAGALFTNPARAMTTTALDGALVRHAKDDWRWRTGEPAPYVRDMDPQPGSRPIATWDRVDEPAVLERAFALGWRPPEGWRSLAGWKPPRA